MFDSDLVSVINIFACAKIHNKLLELLLFSYIGVKTEFSITNDNLPPT